jgi:hypothetical protein
VRLVISAGFLLLFCGVAPADQCGDLVEKWSLTNAEAHGSFKRFLDRHVPSGSCDERAAQCEARRAELDGLNRMLAMVDKVYAACGPRFRSKLGLDKSEMRKTVQDDISHSERAVSSDCSNKELTTGCWSMDGL